MLFNFEGTCEKENTVGIEGRKPKVGSEGNEGSELLKMGV